jgi:predicted phosphodiesterase
VSAPEVTRRVGRATPRWLVRLVSLVVLYAGCVAGGIAATTLFPTTAQTLNYSASLRLSANPDDISAIHSPTLFGDIDVDFAAPLPAPGVLASVQVKQRITDVLSRPHITVHSLQPGTLELEKAARDAAFGLAWRFAAGSLVIALLAIGAYAAWAHARPRPRRVAAALGCWALSCTVTFASAGLAYRPERLDAFKLTGILGAVQRSTDLLAGVESRAEQTTPYLKNLLALSSALQEKYRPQALTRPVAARVLLVSDIHGGNQYPLMRTIVKQEQIDVVIDSGDLVNFGSVAEADAAGIFSGIKSLGVPYLFVRGNHDAMSRGDTALLGRLAKVPNVVLLQPKPDEYTVQSVAGIRIAGFNDPRWFGDDNVGNAAKQKPAAAAFTRAMADLPTPDVVVSHEPGAVSAIDRAGIKVHGHLHTPQLDGSTVGVGTFTGGGPFSHFLEGAKGEELAGQPSSFDVATFGQDCRLASLTRYQFRNVVEGRPAYDDVTLINGSRIEGEPPAAATTSTSTEAGGTTGPTGSSDRVRSCTPSLGLTTESVTAGEAGG